MNLGVLLYGGFSPSCMYHHGGLPRPQNAFESHMQYFAGKPDIAFFFLLRVILRLAGATGRIRWPPLIFPLLQVGPMHSQAHAGYGAGRLASRSQQRVRIGLLVCLGLLPFKLQSYTHLPGNSTYFGIDMHQIALFMV